MIVQEKIYIILVNYNGWKDTIECLESILHNDYNPYQVIVCDNGSTDNSLDCIKKWAEGIISPEIDNSNPLRHLVEPFSVKPVNYSLFSYKDLLNKDISSSLPDDKLIIIDTCSNLGFAGGNNAGVRFALLKNDFKGIWFLNNDTVIEKNSLSELVIHSHKCNNTGKKAGIIGSKLLYYDRPDIIQAAGGIYYKTIAYSKHIGTGEQDSGQFNHDDLKMDYVVGASMFVSKDFIEDIGLMNEEYFIYYEETDWIARGRRKNWVTGYSWRSRVYHKEGAAIGANKQKRTKSGRAVFFFFRNALIFTRHYYPLFLFTVIPRIAATLIFRILTGDKEKVSAMIKAVTGRSYTGSKTWK